jgi:hypothetical protein
MMNQISTLHSEVFQECFLLSFVWGNKRKKQRKIQGLRKNLEKLHFTRCDFLTRSFRRKTNSLASQKVEGRNELKQKKSRTLVLVCFSSIFSKVPRITQKIWPTISPPIYCAVSLKTYQQIQNARGQKFCDYGLPTAVIVRAKNITQVKDNFLMRFRMLFASIDAFRIRNLKSEICNPSTTYDQLAVVA